MKLSWKLIGLVILFVGAIAATVGFVYGINHWGGRVLGDESLLCRRDKLNALSVATDGQTLITGGKYIHVWQIPPGEKLYSSANLRDVADRVIGVASATVSELVITPDQNLFISAASSPRETGNLQAHEISIWNLANRQRLHTLVGHQNRVRFLAVSPDSQTLVSQDDSGVIKFWDLGTRKVKKTLDTQMRQRFPIVLSPDGEVFVSMDKAGIVTLWEIATGKAVGTLKADPSHTPLALSADKKTLLIQNGGDVKRFRDVTTGAELQTLRGSYIEYPFSASPNGNQVLITADAGIILYDLRTGAELKTFNIGKSYREVHITPDGTSFLTIDSQGRHILWNLATGERIYQLEGRVGMGDYAFTASNLLVAGDRAGNDITLWDLQTGERIRRFCNQ